MLSKKIKHHEEAEKAHKDFDLINEKKAQPIWSIIIIGMLSFCLPVIFNIAGLPPFLGLLF